jgi:hypothetical protein
MPPHYCAKQYNYQETLYPRSVACELFHTLDFALRRFQTKADDGRLW